MLKNNPISLKKKIEKKVFSAQSQGVTKKWLFECLGVKQMSPPSESRHSLVSTRYYESYQKPNDENQYTYSDITFTN